MRNAVIQEVWPDLTAAFHNFLPEKILSDKEDVETKVMFTFCHEKKAQAVIRVAETIQKHWLELKQKIQADPLTTLDTLPFIGPVTKFHLARNLGFEYIKPDRHLVRLAASFNMKPEEMCNKIHEATGRRLGTVDVILWRFCEQKGQTILVEK